MKQVTKYVCQQCGAEHLKWQGQCNQCGEWNSLVETVVSTKRSKMYDVRSKINAIKPLKFSEIKSRNFVRVKTGIIELDRVLGGGIVPGSLVLVAGEPGIGKSTLLTQLALQVSSKVGKVEKSSGKVDRSKGSKRKNKLTTSIYSDLPQSTCLYICGEESPEQIKLRINRIVNLKSLAQGRQADILNLLFLPETNMENILASLEIPNPKSQIPNLIIVDSIQSIWTEALSGTAGSVGQVRECANMLLTFAKKTGIPIFLIGHITKEGAIAGPKVLEHLVDTVLYLEGERQHDFRILRTSKNRFGPTDEVGVFKMSDKGMEEVSDPAEIFLSEDGDKKTEGGKAIAVTMQGIRPMLVEIQALVVASNLAMPRRVASGISYQKLQVLCAVIQKKLGIPLYSSDVFVNVAGGLKLTEPAVDLGICLAIISSFKNKPLLKATVCIGEVGLLGEIRRVSFMEKRVKEARKLGFKNIIGEKERDLRQAVGGVM